MNACGSCAHWQPEERGPLGSITVRTKSPWCEVWKKTKYAEDKPESWCWKKKQGEG